MIIDNNIYLMKIGGRPGDKAAWSDMDEEGTWYTDSYDLGSTTNRSIAEGGYIVWRTGTAWLNATSATIEIQLVCSAAAAGGTDTVLCSTGLLAHDASEAKLALNSILFAWKIPQNIPLQYLLVAWTIAAAHFTAGTADVFVTPNAPYPAK